VPFDESVSSRFLVYHFLLSPANSASYRLQAENEYWPKCGDALWLGSKGSYGSFHLWINMWVAGKTVYPSLTCAITECFRDEFLMIKCCTNLQLLLDMVFYCCPSCGRVQATVILSFSKWLLNVTILFLTRSFHFIFSCPYDSRCPHCPLLRYCTKNCRVFADLSLLSDNSVVIKGYWVAFNVRNNFLEVLVHLIPHWSSCILFLLLLL